MPCACAQGAALPVFAYKVKDDGEGQVYYQENYKDSPHRFFLRFIVFVLCCDLIINPYVSNNPDRKINKNFGYY